MNWDVHAKAVLHGYLSGQAGAPALVSLLTGKRNPCGKLAETWFRSLADVPSAKYYGKARKLALYKEGVYVGYRYCTAAEKAPLFPFGHGLSYTAFDYGGVRADKRALGDGETLTVSLTLTNTGKRFGAEAAQVYVGEKGGALRQLKGFEKAALFPGESQPLRIELPYEAFAYFDPRRHARVVRAGTYTVYVGASSEDIRAAFDVELAGDSAEFPAYIAPQEAADMSDERFFALLGRAPAEPPLRPFTLNSTLNELRYTRIGRFVFNIIMKTYSAGNKMDADARLLFERSTGDMPVRALCALSKGALRKNTARAIVDFVNGKPLRGVIHAFKK